MSHILVIHYDPAEAPSTCDRIRREGFEALVYPVRSTRAFHTIAANPPAAIVIDLMQRPSYGRLIGALLRERKSTRTIPLVFIAGEPEKTKRVRELLPDAFFTDILKIGPALRRAIEKAPANPVLPDEARVPLYRKLKIAEDATVALLNAPAELELELPEGARTQKTVGGAAVVLMFVQSEAALTRELPSIKKQMRKGRTFWIAWPKKAGSLAGRLTMPSIRAMCASVDLIDYKVCALDRTWSAMAVGVRKRR